MGANTEIIAIVGLATSTVGILATLAKIQEVKVTVDGKMGQLLDQTGRAARVEATAAGRASMTPEDI